MFPELERFFKILPDPDIVEGLGVIVPAFPEAVQLKVVLVVVPGTEDENPTWALVPEQMVKGDELDGTTLGVGLTEMVFSVGLVAVHPNELLKLAEIVLFPGDNHLSSIKSSEFPPPLTKTAPG